MFKRNILTDLENWKNRPGRKPLIIRGARQVGKTTVIMLFSKSFDQFIPMNMDIEEDRQIFQRFSNIEDLVQAIFFNKGKILNGGKTLIFIDEIQNEPRAVEQLRYFYEQFPGLFVIAAGSLFETLWNTKINFPVGRVEYKILRPVSFPEFLEAIGEMPSLNQLNQIPLNKIAHDKLLKLFHTYSLIGGMPEVVSLYAVNRDITELKPVYESLLVSYLDDVEKYAQNLSQLNVIRHVISSCFTQAGNRIKFQGFGMSNYGSREVGEALRTIEKALLINLIYPVNGTTLPLLPDHKKSPRLMVLDTGLLNHFAGLQKEILGATDLNQVFKGKIAEHITGQELLSRQYDALYHLNFWTREKKGSTAEVDYLLSYEGILVPLEVKSGVTGKLRSLHQFMDMVPHQLAIRIYSGDLKIEKIKSLNDKDYYLLNLPYYLVSRIDQYLDWFSEQVK